MGSQSRHSDRVCFCCARPAGGFGYAPNDRAKVAWVCDDPDCLQIARSSYSMSTKEFTRLQRLAADAGGNQAGAYLDELGKTDLAAMTAEEWSEFCARLAAGYCEALQTTLRNEAPW